MTNPVKNELNRCAELLGIEVELLPRKISVGCQIVEEMDYKLDAEDFEDLADAFLKIAAELRRRER